MTIVTKSIKNHEYYYFQDSLETKTNYKIIDTMIGRTDLPNDQLTLKKGAAFLKHLIKILREYSILKRPQYRFRNKPTEINVISLEAFKLFYQEGIRNITQEEKENFEVTIFVRYVNGTTAIEGNTLDEEQTYKLLMYDLSPSNKTTNDIIEVRNYKILKGYLDNYSYGKGIDEKMIKKIHEIVMKGVVDDKGRHILEGEYRKFDVGITNALCKVTHFQDIPNEMRKLINWYFDGVSRKIHPVELAAIFHHKFECIHPFHDGSGRVGRAILDFMLKNSGFPLIYIPIEDRSRYLDTLAEADLNNHVQLIDFLLHRMIFTMTMLFSKTSIFHGINSNDFKKFVTDYLGDDLIHTIIVDQFIQYRKSTTLP